MKKLITLFLLTFIVIVTNAQTILETTYYTIYDNDICIVDEEPLYYDIHRDVWNQKLGIFQDIIVDSFTGDTIMTVDRLTNSESSNAVHYFYAHLIADEQKSFVKVIYNKNVYAIQMNSDSSIIFFLK